MYNHILIPVAPGHADEYSKAIAAAKALASDGAKISVLTVIEEIPAYVETYIPKETMEANLNEALSDLKGAFGDNAETHVIRGHSANSILIWAEKSGADCIVLSSHRPGLSDYFLGSTASRVVRHAQCSVVVVR